MPVITNDMVAQSQKSKAAMLDDLTIGDLAGAGVHLFTNDFTPGPLNILADYTQATYTGYAPGTVTAWTTVEYLADGGVSTATTNVLTFTGPADTSGETIYGYFVMSAGPGGTLQYGARFDNPVSLEVPTDVLDLVPTFKIAANN